MTQYVRVNFDGVSEQDRPERRIFADLGPGSTFTIGDFNSEPYRQLIIDHTAEGEITISEKPLELVDKAEAREIGKLAIGGRQWITPEKIKTAWSSVGRLSVETYITPR